MNEQQNRVEKYLMKQLSPEEYARFEKELGHNASLKEQLDIAKQEHEAMELLLERDLRASMKQWQQPDVSPVQPRRWWLIAAIIAVIVAISAWLLLPVKALVSPVEPPGTIHMSQLPPPITPGSTESSRAVEQPMAQINNNTAPRYLLAYNDHFFYAETRGNKSKRPPHVQKVIDHYREKDYAIVIQLTDHISADNFFLTLTEYRAHAFYQLKKYRQASEQFKILSESAKEPFAERSDWYGLICLSAQLPSQQEAYNKMYQKIRNTSEHAFGDSLALLLKKD